MRVTMRLFAGHRERAGTDRLQLDLPNDSTAHDAFLALAQRYPALGETEPFTTFARNRQVVGPAEPLGDGDEVALLQPVSGG